MSKFMKLLKAFLVQFLTVALLATSFTQVAGAKIAYLEKQDYTYNRCIYRDYSDNYLTIEGTSCPYSVTYEDFSFPTAKTFGNVVVCLYGVEKVGIVRSGGCPYEVTLAQGMLQSHKTIELGDQKICFYLDDFDNTTVRIERYSCPTYNFF